MSRAARWHCFPDAGAVARELVRRVTTAAQAAIAAHGRFRVVLAGGSTPLKAYQLLSAEPADWACWEIYLGDERCLPAGHAQRNSTAIQRAWLDHVPAAPVQIHWIAAERGAAAAAADYGKLVRAALPFDLVLLGMGEDGHTASLFPGDEHDPASLVVAVQGAPKPPPERVSLNYPALAESRALLLVVTGAAKRQAAADWKRGKPLPVSRLRCAGGIDVIADHAAGADWCGATD